MTLQKLLEWSRIEQLLIDVSEYSVMHTGHQNTYKYTVNKNGPPVARTHNELRAIVS